MKLVGVVFRADASTKIGSGHIMRCLSLAERFKKAGDNPVFAVCVITSALINRLLSEGITAEVLTAESGSEEDAKQTIQLARKNSASWIVIDGYHFNSNFQRILTKSGFQVLMIDDYGNAGHYYADIVVNQNLHAIKSLYEKRESYTRLLLGTQFAILRMEFLKWQYFNRKIPNVALKILVTLGQSSQAHEVSLKVLNSIKQVKVAGIKAILVSSDCLDLEASTESQKTANYELIIAENIACMADIMAWADLAISAGGTTALELAYMGLPSLLLSLADNQIQVVDELSKNGISQDLGWYTQVTEATIADRLSNLINSPDERATMSTLAQKLVATADGADRIVSIMKGMSSETL